jgi:ribose-phosphate pyrophosphokinase
MKYLYLDQKYKPFLTDMSSSSEITHESKTWAGGEEHIRITYVYPLENEKVVIVSRCNTSSEVMRILMANDALQRLGVETIHLFVPYLPYARQDDVMNQGEALSCKVFADLINTCGFKSVSVLDPHSNVEIAQIKNFKILVNEYYRFVTEAFTKISKTINGTPCVVSPDSGAYKKIFKTCSAIGFNGDIVSANKARNLATGEIISLTISGDVKDRDCVIIDDICDGGRTFAEVAEQLKALGAKSVFLIATHGIFSYGEDQLKPNIDHVYTTNSFREFKSDFITFLEFPFK